MDTVKVVGFNVVHGDKSINLATKPMMLELFKLAQRGNTFTSAELRRVVYSYSRHKQCSLNAANKLMSRARALAAETFGGRWFVYDTLDGVFRVREGGAA